MSGKIRGDEKESSIEYTAHAVSSLFTDDVRLKVGETALAITSLFDVMEIPYAGINALILSDYTIILKTDDGDFSFSKMGNWCKPFYDALSEAFNEAVLRSLFVKNKPILTAKGVFSCAENGGVSNSSPASIHVYEDRIVALPSGLGARLIPLCFVKGMNKGDYELTLKLDADESYTFARLGFGASSFADALEKQIRLLREKSLTAVKKIDPFLSSMLASQIAKLMPLGVTASLGQLTGIAPSFTAALESLLSHTRAAESYAAFKELCDQEMIHIGIRLNEADADTAKSTAEKTELSPTPYLLWLIAPSPDGKSVAVEFAEVDTATYVYRTGGSFEHFIRQLNRALAAVNFVREAIYMSDEALRKPDKSDYYMAVKRNPALQFLRSNLVGSVIHHSLDAWKRKLIELWSID